MMNDSQFKDIFAQMNDEVLGADEGWNDISNSLAKNRRNRYKRIALYSLVGVGVLISAFNIYMAFNTADVPQYVPTGDGIQIEVRADSTSADTSSVLNSDSSTIQSLEQSRVQLPKAEKHKEQFKQTASKPLPVSDSAYAPKQLSTPTEESAPVQPQVSKKKGSTRIMIVEDTVVQYDTIRVDSRK